MANKTGIRSAVQSMINNAQITDEIFDGLLLLFEAELFSDLKPGFRSQIIEDVVSVNGEIFLPTKCKDIRALYVESSSGVWDILKQYSLVDLYANKDNTSNTPTHYAKAYSGGSDTDSTSPVLILNTNSDGENFKLFYFESAPNTIAGGPETNWISEDYPTLYFYGLMKWANEFLLNDEQAAKWETKYMAYKMFVEEQERSRMYSGSPLVTNPRSQEKS